MSKKVNKTYLAKKFKQQNLVAHASRDTTSPCKEKRKKPLKGILKKVPVTNGDSIPKSVAEPSQKKGRNKEQCTENSEEMDSRKSVFSNGTHWVTTPPTEDIEVEIDLPANADNVQSVGDNDVELVDVSEYGVTRKNNKKNTVDTGADGSSDVELVEVAERAVCVRKYKTTTKRKESEVFKKTTERLAAEEAQLLATEKWILEELKKISAHKDRLRLERLELEKMRALLVSKMQEPRRQIYHYRHVEPASEAKTQTAVVTTVPKVISVEIIED